MERMKLSFSLSELDFGVKFLAVGLLGSFSSKTQLTRRATLKLPINFLDTLLKKKLQKHGSNKTAQHTSKQGRLFRGYLCSSEMESFSKGCTPAHSPSLSPPDFFPMGLHKYSGPREVDELKTNISNITADISLTTFRAVCTVCTNMLLRVRLCMQRAHFFSTLL